MGYKLIVVDDEPFMLQSISRIIDWDEIGFELSGSFSDGLQAVEYIKNNAVDVVLTDIKMPKMDGLQLVEFLYNHYPSIKTILISGHQDFEFARQAIKFNVSHYLLKPTRHSELVQTFEEVRTQLDQKKEEYDELLPLVIKQFFFDLSTGAMQQEETINKYLEAIGMDKSVKNNTCCIALLHMEDYQDYIKSVWKHGVEGFSTAMQQFFSNQENGINFYFFHQIDKQFKVIGISTEEKTADQLKEEAMQYFRFKHDEIQELIGAVFHLDDLSVYASLMELTKAGGYLADQSLASKIQGHAVQGEFENLLIYYINSGDVEAVNNLLSNYYMRFGQMDIEIVREFNLRVLNKLTHQSKQEYAEAFEACQDTEQMRRLSRNTFASIAAYAQQHESSEKQLIYKAKKYITEHCCEDISLEIVAQNIYASPVYISRLFKGQTGQNFIDYLTDIRMQKAMELLKDPKLKVYEVSEIVGYKSLKYFYKLFKQYAGITPTEYRNNSKD